MRRGLRTISMVVFFLAVCSCSGSKSDPAEPTRTTKRPTVCPRSDGHPAASHPLRSVRILDFDGTRMFVPSEWLRGYIDDGRSRSDKFFRETVSRAIIPDIDSEDCPGTIHYFVVGKRASRFGSMSFATHGPLPLPPAERKAMAGKVVQIFVAARPREDIGAPIWPDEDVSTHPTGRWVKFRNAPIYKYNGAEGSAANGCTAEYENGDDAWLLNQRVSPAISIGLVVQSEAETPVSDWSALCAKIIAFFRWLKTPPPERDSSFKFDPPPDQI